MPKFAKGKPKTGGRRKETPNRSTVRARRLVSEAADKAIVDRVVAAARTGADPHATAIYFRYLRPPPPKPTYAAQPIDLPPPTTAQEARDAIARITSMVARAEIDGEHGSRVIAGLEAFLSARVADLEEKVKAMFDARNGNGADEEPVNVTPAEIDAMIIDLRPGPEEPEGNIQ